MPFEEDNPDAASLVVALFQRSLAYLEMTLAGQVIVPGVSRKGDVAAKAEALQHAYRLGTESIHEVSL